MPETGITIRGISYSKLRIEPTEIKAEGGPIYPRLVVPLRVDFNPGGVAQQFECFTTLAVECGLFLTDHQLKVSDATPVTNLVTVRSTGSYSPIWDLEFPLDSYRVKAIDAKRHGDLKLRFDFAFVFGLFTPAAIPNRPNQGPIDVLVGFEKSSSQLYVEVPQSHWVGKVLPMLGSSTYIIVEVPVRNDQIASAWALIEKAENAFGRWDTKAVFAHCREAVQALTNLIAQHHPQDSFLRDERWSRAIKEFNHFASLDLHLEEIKAKKNYSPDHVKIEKPDAECVLIFAKALAKYAEELIR